jgi:pyruvate dehydrogenase E2 component (dihydrolipoamide acetyltransferase)
VGLSAPAPAPARRRISPAARKKAAECGIDFDALTGTGADGAITLQDVEAAAQAAKAAPAGRQAEMRKAIAAAMSRSKREIPHYYLSEPVPMRAALDWLAAANADRPVTDRLLLAVLQLKAVALALRAFPDMNGYYRDGAFESVPAAHVGVAIALRQGGLVAPALLDVANKPLDQLMRELADLVRRARAGSLRSSEMGDATITVTNLGEQGVEMVSGVIYPPQVALVGFGRLTDRPWVRDGGLCAMPVVTATLAADHRVSDGHRGALFLAAIRDLLQNPSAL